MTRTFEVASMLDKRMTKSKAALSIGVSEVSQALEL